VTSGATSANAGFTFQRSRGLVWVCDLANSTRALNDDASVDALEEFIPRLYWTSMQAVEAIGGLFVKWAGDGFLA
jgi:class 3 adenylate cyclase